MSIDTERGLLARYAARVLADPSLPLPAALSIVTWFKDRLDLYDFAPPPDVARALSKFRKKGRLTAKCERTFIDARSDYICQIRRLGESATKPDQLTRNIGFLLDAFDLPAHAFELLFLSAAHERWHRIDTFVYRLKHAVGGVAHPIALLTQTDRTSIEKFISPNSELVQKGALRLDANADDLLGRYGRIQQSDRIDPHLDGAFETLGQFREAVLGSPLSPVLSYQDFTHAAAKRDLLTNMLSGSALQRIPGINILLYGAPGTGKTELAKTAARSAKVALYAAGENIVSGREPTRQRRLNDLFFTEQLLDGSGPSAILFDELEDVALDLLDRGGSKLHLNRILERNRVPVVWTSNNIHNIDKAIIRRMTLTLEISSPPHRQRSQIWRQVADRLDVKLSDRDCDKLGRKVSGEPSVIYNATLAAKLAGGGSKTAERAAADQLWALGTPNPPMAHGMVPFDPQLAPANMDLNQLTQTLRAAPACHISLCLSGPPGTGKTAYAHHIAEQLGLEFMKKRASDLLDKWVGSTEQRIAEAFNQAAEQGAFLFFDEADSLLSDRQHARQRWEISQVNEMLTWMEDHPLPFCCATNLLDRLDPAAMRRFTFHIRFHHLQPAGIKRAWKVFFKRRAPQAVTELPNLTPGDFAQTKRRAEVLGVTNDDLALVGILTECSAGKPGAVQKIGFVRS